jgi:hypothetical protein
MGKLVLGGVLLVAAFFLMVARAGMAGRREMPSAPWRCFLPLSAWRSCCSPAWW